MTNETYTTDNSEKSISKAMEALSAVQQSLATSAAEITRGEFGSSGAGASGIAFRAIKNLPDESMEDVWSQILSICSLLWEKNEAIAAIVLIETAAGQFFVPAAMEERVKASIESAKNLKIMKSAEEAFAQGDDDKALRITSELTPAARANFSQDLKSRIDRRQTSRKTAVWVAGVSISSLAVVAVIGIFSFLELIKDPPRPQLPDFKDSERMFSDIFSPAKPVKPSIIIPKPSQAESAASAIPAETLGQQLIFTPTIDGPELNPDAPDPVITLPIPAPVYEAPQDRPAAIITPAPQQADTPDNQTVPPTKVTRENCVIGFAALQRATALMQQRPDDTTARRKVAGFMSTLQEACKNLSLDPVALSLEAGMVPADQVDAIARGIIE